MITSTASRRRLQTAILVIFIALLIGPACAEANFDRCCIESAREQLETLQMVPWDACGINQTDQSVLNPLVNSTLGWCEKNCAGFQLNDFGQWSDLLTTFIVPAFAQLLLCPVGSGGEEEEEEEEGEEEDRQTEENLKGSQEKSDTTSGVREVPQPKPSFDSYEKKQKRVRQTIVYLVCEYVVLLGDPASAMAACFYQLWRDLVYVWGMTREESLGTFKEHVRGFAIIAGQTTLQATGENPSRHEVTKKDVDGMVTLIQSSIPKFKEAQSEQDSNTTTVTGINPPSGDEAISPIPIDQAKAVPTSTRDPEKHISAPNGSGSNERKSLEDDYARSELRKELHAAIEMLLKAKIDFVNGIVIPVVLTFAGTAAGFYNAYTVLGNRDKGYSLAFGVFYAWLFVLSVVSNCYTITVNPTLLEGALNSIFRFCTHNSTNSEFATKIASQIRLRVVPYRKRIPAFVMWKRWVVSMENLTLGQADTAPPPLPTYNAAFFAKFLFLQTAGWLVISVFTALATVIAYNTPTIGIGCRAFTFLLYTLLSLILAWLLVVREAVAQVVARAKDRKERCDGLETLVAVLRYLYGGLALFNAFVMVGGTTFHLVGLYRSCRCQLLFGRADALVLLSTGTALDMDRAKKYWISVGYVAFTFAWMVCSVAIAAREFIVLHLSNHFLGVTK